jgi:hypothetical protein
VRPLRVLLSARGAGDRSFSARCHCSWAESETLCSQQTPVFAANADAPGETPNFRGLPSEHPHTEHMDMFWRPRSPIGHARAGTAGGHGLDHLLQPFETTLGAGLPQPDAVRTTLGWRRSTRLPLDDRVMHSDFQGQPQAWAGGQGAGRGVAKASARAGTRRAGAAHRELKPAPLSRRSKPQRWLPRSATDG